MIDENIEFELLREADALDSTAEAIWQRMQAPSHSEISDERLADLWLRCRENSRQLRRTYGAICS